MNCAINANVLATANFRADHRSPADALKCIRFLQAVIADGERVCMDDQDLIFKEYRSYASMSGSPNVGDQFLKWLFERQGNSQCCELAPISPNDSRGFDEFPDDAALADFDPSDRKYVAVALKSAHRPPIVSATDSDWAHHAVALAAHGAQIQELL